MIVYQAPSVGGCFGSCGCASVCPGVLCPVPAFSLCLVILGLARAGVLRHLLGRAAVAFGSVPLGGARQVDCILTSPVLSFCTAQLSVRSLALVVGAIPADCKGPLAIADWLRPAAHTPDGHARGFSLAPALLFPCNLS